MKLAMIAQWKVRGLTHALLDQLNVIMADTDPSGTSKVPTSLDLCVLNHDSGEHNNLGIYVIQDRTIREVETVGYFDRQPS